ncbi:SRR1 domain-containing protein [Purpureocillium lavendulum]|uniref:SRR1 domain-containing protein n=1 Tax=Purpureocillium lavendulum TaxID=1247861 RepID=A0AB34FU84_9HYPO|nr:SRR1 domain-containing protein [Purpureocillium lavendulum]
MPAPKADDGEWTTIKPKNRRHRGNRTHDNPHNQSPLSGASPSSSSSRHKFSPPARTDPPRSVASIESEYNTLRRAFETTSCCASLRALAARIAATDGTSGHRGGRRRRSSGGDGNQTDKTPPPVTKAVCLGIGTFDPPDGGWEPRRRTFLQLIAFVVLVEELERLTHTTIPCIFQEPIFTASDAAFLTSSLGHSVVEHPRACRAVDRRTLLYGVHLYRPIYALALAGGGKGGANAATAATAAAAAAAATTFAASDGDVQDDDDGDGLPAVFVGTGWDVWDAVTLGGGGDEEGDEADDGFMARLRLMEDTYARADFPQDEAAHGTAFSSTSVYWRRGPGVSGEDLEGEGEDGDETATVTAAAATPSEGGDRGVRRVDEAGGEQNLAEKLDAVRIS